MAKCSLIKVNGIQCGANSHSNSEFCFRHDPANKQSALEASKTGGENRRLQQKCGETVKIENTHDITRLLAETINGVWTGTIPVQAGTTIGFLSNCWLKAYEVSGLEDRMNKFTIVLDDVKGGSNDTLATNRQT